MEFSVGKGKEKQLYGSTAVLIFNFTQQKSSISISGEMNAKRYSIQ
ncbi:hypothetical protein BGM26_21235 [Bacillus sp. FJAT-29790]|nr:hypothetical protein [Bacillus sp. FJAT-29790]MBU8881447.1 hypothetical protein [Bacillus sp. FJAT-29790]